MEAGGARQQTSTQTLTPKARRRHISCQLGHLLFSVADTWTCIFSPNQRTLGPCNQLKLPVSTELSLATCGGGLCHFANQLGTSSFIYSSFFCVSCSLHPSISVIARPLVTPCTSIRPRRFYYMLATRGLISP